MSDSVETTAASPTGQPALPDVVRKLIPWFGLLVLVVGAVQAVGLFEGTSYERIATKICGLVLTLGVGLGIASPGWRKAAPLVLLLVALPLASCTMLNLTGPCHVQVPEQTALGLRSLDSVTERYENGHLTQAEAIGLYQKHAADAEMGFSSYRKCQP